MFKIKVILWWRLVPSTCTLHSLHHSIILKKWSYKLRPCKIIVERNDCGNYSKWFFGPLLHGFLYPWHTKYAEGVDSFRPFRLSIRPSVRQPFYNQVLLGSFLITYNSAATDQKLFIFGMGVPERVLFHSTSMDLWVMPQGGARGQNLGHPNKVIYCSLFIQTSSY